jgi:hypothetical protein
MRFRPEKASVLSGGSKDHAPRGDLPHIFVEITAFSHGKRSIFVSSRPRAVRERAEQSFVRPFVSYGCEWTDGKLTHSEAKR